MKLKVLLLRNTLKLKNMNENILLKIEDFLKIIWMILLSILSPISVPIYVLTVFFVLNFFIGFQTDRIVNKVDFSMEKIKKGVKLFLLYFVIIFVVNLSLSLFQEDELAITIPKFITWIACYWYLVNTLRNSIQLFPDSEGLKFFYNLMTVQVLDIILSKFGLNKKDDEEGNSK
jgi:hypothetical protein